MPANFTNFRVVYFKIELYDDENVITMLEALTCISKASSSHWVDLEI